MMKKGFTLVELMIVVAIIGILAAIAIPNFVEMQYRAKRAEVPANVDGIKTAEMSYDAAFDGFLALTAHPTATPGKSQVAWTGGNAEFQKLGWAPDGSVRGQYSATLSGTSDFVVLGECDVDGDNTKASYTATKTINSTFNSNNDTY